MFATWFRLTVALLPSGRRPVALVSFAICDPSAFPTVGDGQPANAASAGSAPPAWFGPPLLPSVARGVFHPKNATVLRLLSLFPASLLPFCAGVPAMGVGQPAKVASRTRHAQPCFVPCKSFCPCERPETSCACGVVQPFRSNSEALADVRGACERAAGINRPDGVALSFQVVTYKIEPVEAVLARNLLAKPDVRASLADEVEHCRP
jgi:hypothetical protein